MDRAKLHLEQFWHRSIQRLRGADYAAFRAKVFSKRNLNKRIAARIFLIAGALLLAFAAFEYASMYTAQKRLQRAWQAQQSRPAVQLQNTAAADDGLTRLLVPKINLDAVIVEGTAYRQLAIAPGHVRHTPSPGDAGNSVISAHRDTFFRHIYELNKGDVVQVQRRGKMYTFQVSGKKIVEPDDLSVERRTKDTELTLLTCYPIYYIGPAPQRLVVTTKLVSVNATTNPTSQVAATARH